jgi:hypothetical protein
VLSSTSAQDSHHSWFPTVMACTPISFWKGGASLPLYTTLHTAGCNKTSLRGANADFYCEADDLVTVSIVRVSILV